MGGDQQSSSGAADQVSNQAKAFDEKFAHGSRNLVTSGDPLVRYLTRWRMEMAWRRFTSLTDLGHEPSVLILCAGDGGEATVLADLGVTDITITDNSERAVTAALGADPRLSGFVCNALDSGIDDDAFDIVIVQDGLHHLPEPVRGFTEMLRIGRRGAFFLEGSDSLAGRLIGKQWEIEAGHENYVFRWSRHLVDQVTNAYLGRDRFRNGSFSFWHHNVHMHRLGQHLGAPKVAARRIDTMKRWGDILAPRGGNQFCGMVTKKHGIAPPGRH